MSSKINRASRGPSWTEVVLGAVLSLILGGLIGAVLLVIRPVVEVKDGAKAAERDPRQTYFTPGTRDGSKGRSALAKRTSFAQGQSVTVIEDELNALAAMPATPGGAPTAEKGKAGDKAAPPPSDTISAGAMNFRIRDGVFQVATPVTFNVLGISSKVIVQSQGTFSKDTDQFVYVPATFYIGALPLQRVPFAAGYIRSKFLSAQSVPDDIRTSWAKLANVSIEGNALKLTMP